jgi:hypothetical protein
LLRQIGYHGEIAGDGKDGGPIGADEIAAEMADSWSPGNHPALYPFLLSAQGRGGRIAPA